MFVINDDKSIYVTRGDAVVFNVKAKLGEAEYVFRAGDVVRFKVFEKKKCDKVVLKKDVTVTEETTTVQVFVTAEETKFGKVINKPVDYWYEIELNPDGHAQTIIGYDDDGAKVLRLFPEGGSMNE
jgi:hypothetical protein